MDSAFREGFRVGDFDVRPLQGRIAGPDGDVKVQPKVADVLLCLARAPGEVVSRQVLNDEVWGNVIVTDDALNRCVSELRRIFGDRRGQTRYIETVPKRGYRLLPKVESLSRSRAADAAATAEPDAPTQPPSLESAMATVAVLPFNCLTPDSPHAFLAEALPMALHSGLARLGEIRVSSRRSSFALRDSEAPADELGQQLGAQYIVSGNIAEAGDRIRVITEVDDAEAGIMLWSQRFEVPADDILSFEQQLMDAVIGAFGGQRLRAEISRAQEAPPTTLDAWGLVQRARAYLVRYRAKALRDARELVARAAEKDPEYALAHAMHGLLIAENMINGLSEDPQADRAAALAAVERALALAPTEPAVLRSCGCAQAYCGDYRRALKSLRRTVKLAPYDLGAWGYFCWPLAATGVAEDLDELHSICDRLLDVAPSHPGAPYWNYHRSVAFTCAGEFEAALEPIETCLEAQPEFALGLMHYANLLGQLDRPDEAGALAQRAVAANQALTADRYAEIVAQLTDQPDVRDRRTAGLRGIA